MSWLGVDHTAIVVQNLDEAVPRYERLYNCPAGRRSRVADQKVEVVFFVVGNSQIELISPTSTDTGVSRFLEVHGERLHHIGIQVDDIEAEIRRLEGLGVQMIDRRPRPGVHGLIAFVHPRGTGGVLTELVQRSETQD